MDAGRIRYSITSKLNRKLFFRLLGLFTSLNIIIFLIACAGLWYYAERKIVNAAVVIDEFGIPENVSWLEFSGVSVIITPITTPSPGFSPAFPYPGFIPAEYRDNTYYKGFRAQPNGPVYTVLSIDYVANIRREAASYEIAVNIGSFIIYFLCAFALLLAFELLTLMSRTVGDRKMVRKTLDPIADLARAAQTLNEVSKQIDQDNMMALAGRLNGIDAGRLDIRIQVDDLQEELRNLAIAINGMLDRINQSYAAQSRFVSDASHELRTPIAVIQGYANLLDRWGKKDEKTLTESVTAIKDEAENMKGLVEQLLFLARGDSNTMRIKEERLELSKLVYEVAEEERMLDSGHEFNVSGNEVFVMADRQLIKQALRILVDNAVKYSDSGGEITISTGSDGTYAKISVSDNGIGINPEVIPYVLNRFVRADESRTRATGGAGLGLSIAQWIVNHHSGHMEILSREGVGTRITIVIPVAPEPQPEPLVEIPTPEMI